MRRLLRSGCWLLVAGLFVWNTSAELQGQEESTEASGADASVRAGSQLAIPAGARSFAPGKWGLVDAHVANLSQADGEFTALTFFDGHPHEQFGRRFWVPAGAQRSTWYLVRAPMDSRFEQSFEVHSKLLHGGEEVALRQRYGQMHQQGLLPTGRTPPHTGFILTESQDEQLGQLEQDAFEMVAAARLAVGATRRLSLIYGSLLPPVPEALESVQQLVISNDRLADDPAAAEAVRQWIAAGGTAWIMLDLVQSETVECLLGNTFQGQLVDTVGLNQFEIEQAATLGTETLQPARQSFEEPVTFARYLISDVEILSRVRGWPAAFSRDVGRGRVFFTTLGARGWVRPAQPGENPPFQPLYTSSFRANVPLTVLSQFLFFDDREREVGQDELRPYVTEQIGYQIVGRGTILAILTTFCGVLSLCGIVLTRAGRLAHMGWIGPAIAILAAIPLAWVAVSSKTAVPSTVAMAQLVQAGEGTDELRVSGLLAFYRPESRASELGLAQSGIFQTELTAGAETRRMIWTDIAQWHWQDYSLPPGVRTAPFQSTARTSHPTTAIARFGPRGLEGHLSLPPQIQDPADALLHNPSRPPLAVELKESQEFHKFLVRPSDMMAKGQYLAGSLLSDEQRRRRDVYRSLLDKLNPMTATARPKLYFWSRPIDLHLRGTDDMQHVGSAFVEVPLSIERTLPDTPVQIPAPFVPFRTLTNAKGNMASTLYDHRRDLWLELPNGREVWMHFQMPSEVLPMQLSRVTLTIRINAPSRTLTVKTRRGAEEITVFERPNASGTIRVLIEGPERLRLDDEGRLLLGLFVSEAEGERTDILWNIDHLGLTAEGRTLASSLSE